MVFLRNKSRKDTKYFHALLKLVETEAPLTVI